MGIGARPQPQPQPQPGESVMRDRVRPFPWTSLEPITRRETEIVRVARRWAASVVDPKSIGSVMASLLNEPVEVRTGRARALRGAPGHRTEVGVLLARERSPEPSDHALVEAESALVARVVARALQRPASFVVDAAAQPPAAMAGAFGAVLLAAARRAYGGVSLRLVGAGAASDLESQLEESSAEFAAVTFTVLLGDDAFDARLVLPSDALPRTDETWTRRSLLSLGPTPLRVPLVAWSTWMTAAEVSCLTVGDAFVPPLRAKGALSRTPGGVSGTVLLAPSSFDVGVIADLGEDGRLVLRGQTERIPTEAPMETVEKEGMIAALGEVPVVVRVEVGETTMSAREWASLEHGDVVALGRRVGELVLVRVGGVPLARGELVDLEGEVAVRIVERFGGETAAR